LSFEDKWISETKYSKIADGKTFDRTGPASQEGYHAPRSEIVKYHGFGKRFLNRADYY
jgi:hypothetical protein